jgi:hypothetical protein
MTVYNNTSFFLSSFLSFFLSLSNLFLHNYFSCRGLLLHVITYMRPTHASEHTHTLTHTLTHSHTHSHTHCRTLLDDRPVAKAFTCNNSQHLEQKKIHAPGGIQTRNPINCEATELSLGPLGHRDRPYKKYI